MSGLRHRFEARVVRAWYRGAWWLFLLWPLSLLVAIVVRHRYRRRQRVDTLPVPVIVVGGITVGGTGKTPVVIALAEFLAAQGLRVGVVSRGYGGSTGDRILQVEAGSPAAVVGDEPLLIARRTGVPVVVGRDWCQAWQQLTGRTSLDVVLSDDGLQHYALPRSYEIAVVDGQRGLGTAKLLPMGPLREPASRLEAVDWVLVRNGGQPDSGFHYRPCHLECLQSGQRVEPGALSSQWRGQRVAAVTALGQPEQFFDTLEGLGLVVERVSFPDHYPITEGDLGQIQADIIVMTEKDAVKLQPSADARIWVLAIAAELPDALLHDLKQRFVDSGGGSCSTS